MENRVPNVSQRISSHDRKQFSDSQEEVVLVHNDTPRINWRLAVIEDVITGHDGLIRAVNIRMSNGRISRLYPLEISCKTDPEQASPDIVNDYKNSDPSTTQECQSQDVRPTRKAAMKACERAAEWISILRGCR